MKDKLNKIFKINERKSSVKVEIYAGLSTFLAMAYILIVNPNNLLLAGSADARWSSVFIATALGAFIGCVLMAFIGNMPLGLASSLGINSVAGAIIGGSLGLALSYGNVMLILFTSGLIFIILSYIKINTKKGKMSVREYLLDGIPITILKAIPVGLGLFIAFIGLQNAGIIEPNQFTLVQLVKFNNLENWEYGENAFRALVALFGLIVIAILSHYKVKGSVIIGILSSTLISIPLGVSNINILLGKVNGITWNIWENFSNYFSMNPNKGGIFMSLFTEGFNFPKGSALTVIILIVTFLILDTFDTMGTIIGCAKNADMVDSDGKPLNYDKIMYADSLAACTGTMVGTSTVTTFIESGTGISSGGRTGLTALVIAIMFILSIFALPLFAFIPIEAASGALIYVGVLMMKNVLEIDFSNIKNALPAFLTIIIMPLSYSVTDGIGIGLISYFIIDLVIYMIDYFKYLRGKIKEPKFDISIVMIISTILFLIYFLMPTII